MSICPNGVLKVHKNHKTSATILFSDFIFLNKFWYKLWVHLCENGYFANCVPLFA